MSSSSNRYQIIFFRNRSKIAIKCNFNIFFLRVELSKQFSYVKYNITLFHMKFHLKSLQTDSVKNQKLSFLTHFSFAHISLNFHSNKVRVSPILFISYINLENEIKKMPIKMRILKKIGE